jgi:hypothetical protein
MSGEKTRRDLVVNRLSNARRGEPMLSLTRFTDVECLGHRYVRFFFLRFGGLLVSANRDSHETRAYYSWLCA